MTQPSNIQERDVQGLLQFVAFFMSATFSCIGAALVWGIGAVMLVSGFYALLFSILIGFSGGSNTRR